MERYGISEDSILKVEVKIVSGDILLTDNLQRHEEKHDRLFVAGSNNVKQYS